MKKAKVRKKKEREKKTVPGREASRLDKAKITTLPAYTPGELPKR